uniref:SET domain-containing protein n=1 Tax=Entomoneis paludosa TaxID=265537 RepID=A0A7S3DT21_9STRA
MAAQRRVKKMNEAARAQRRFKVGNGQTNLVRDVAMFLFVIIAFIWYGLSSEFDGSNRDQQESENSKIPLADSINKAADRITMSLMESSEKARRKDPCPLFMARSSIPSADQGLYAGQDYAVGDPIFETPWFIPLSDRDNDEGYVSSLALLVKFHPTLWNIDGAVVKQANEGQDYVFRATRPIEEGDELFLPYEKHPAYLLQQNSNTADTAALFQQIPTLDDYNTADKVAQKVLLVSRQMEVAHSRKQKNAIRNMETSYLYALGRSVADQFNPVVSSLLPSTRGEYNKRDMDNVPSYLSALKNRTLSELQILGSCISDISGPTASSTTKSITSTRQFQKNDQVALVPLYFMPQSGCAADEQEQQCTIQQKNQNNNPCLSIGDSMGSLCPLSSFDISTPSDPSEAANVEVQWKSKSIGKLTLEQVRSGAPGSLLLKVVALTSIEIGDKLVVAKSATLVDELIPSTWRS